MRPCTSRPPQCPYTNRQSALGAPEAIQRFIQCDIQVCRIRLECALKLAAVDNERLVGIGAAFSEDPITRALCSMNSRLVSGFFYLKLTFAPAFARFSVRQSLAAWRPGCRDPVRISSHHSADQRETMPRGATRRTVDNRRWRHRGARRCCRASQCGR